MRPTILSLLLFLLLTFYSSAQGLGAFHHRAAELPVQLITYELNGYHAVSRILNERETRQRESWFSRDKFYHLFGSAALSGGGYWALEATHNEEDQSMAACFGITVCLGGAKEIYDLHHPGRHASWMDFTADVIGAALGIIIAQSLLH